jgi:hypothetical protein
MLKPRRRVFIFPTQIFPNGLPDKEQQAAEYIRLNLILAGQAVSTFSSAIDLYDDCCSRLVTSGPPEELKRRADNNRMLFAWQQMAARIGAISIREFYKAKEVAKKLLDDCPTIKQIVVNDMIKTSDQLFEQSFPGFPDIRHFAAHHTEMVGDPTKDKTRPTVMGSIVRGLKNNPLPVLGCIDPQTREYTNTLNDVQLSYALSEETERILTECYRTFNEAFEAAGAETLRVARMTLS